MPRICERKNILHEAHITLAHPSPDRLYQLLKTSYYWHGLRDDCHQIHAQCHECTKEKAKFKQPHYLHPTIKPLGIFLAWSIDLIGPLPESNNGDKWVIVAVDCYSRWVELAALKDKASDTTARWFMESILARYGKCAYVRTD